MTDKYTDSEMKLILLVVGVLIFPTLGYSENSIAVSAPMTTDLAGKNANVALQSVFRIIDTERGLGGTGFLHKSGKIITAAHVVTNPNLERIKIVLADGSIISVKAISLDVDHDLGLVTPDRKIAASPINISQASSIPIGAQVTTWGFPAGYAGNFPMLTVGYIAGIDKVIASHGKIIPKYVVNAAFNGGNSGGPLLNVEDGSVIGVVSSKLAPIPLDIASALEALKKQPSGFMYTARTPDGKEISFSEGQVVGAVLEFLRSQTQLVIGQAATNSDLIIFLKNNKIDP